MFKRALLILHQKKSVAGDLGIKLKKRGYKLDFCRPSCGEILPSNLNNFSIIIMFGGPMSANDNEDFLNKEINFMKLVINSRVPFLGICLGAQILAKYLGSKIKKNNLQLSEIGFYKIEPSKEGRNIFNGNNMFYQFHSEGFDLPPDCEPLAYGVKFKYQAFKYKNCYALQFHPEVNFIMHLRWLFFILLDKPLFLFKNSGQNIFIQIFLRIKYNKSTSLWLDKFLDNYLLNQK